MSKKTSISTEEFISMLPQIGMKSFTSMLVKLDPSLTEEDFYYYHERLQFYYRSSKEKITMGQAAVIMIQEEKVESITVVIAMFGFCNFKMGFDLMKRDAMGSMLDKLADDFEKKTGIKKVIIRSDEPDKSPFGEHDNTSMT